MSTQLESARRGEITAAMEVVARDEGVSAEEIRERVARGAVVIPKNKNHDFSPRGIGEGLKTKVNANIGTSGFHGDIEEELTKLKVAVNAGADAVMDLSTGEDLDATRKFIIENSPLMVGTVPIYDVATELARQGKEPDELTDNAVVEAVRRHAEQGVDFITIHSGITLKDLPLIDRTERVGGIVSRGGALIVAYMRKTGKENPYYALFDEFIEIAREYDVTFSLGDGCRPGAIADATDAVQMAELYVLGELAERSVAAGVQTMIEGPGHVPLDQIEANVLLEKKICGGAPFYTLGPLTTDIAPGFDHITAAIGGALAAAAGVDFLCYVTPAEHLKLPTAADVAEGVFATRIAAHSGDLVKGVKGAAEWDRAMSEARKKLDWEKMYELALCPERAKSMRKQSESFEQDVCTMCGELCSIKRDSVSRTAGE